MKTYQSQAKLSLSKKKKGERKNYFYYYLSTCLSSVSLTLADKVIKKHYIAFKFCRESVSALVRDLAHFLLRAFLLFFLVVC